MRLDKDEDRGESRLVELAIEVAARAHAGQVRKATDIPYISHPYTVGMMLARAGMPEEVVAAGILHDTVEDTPLSLEYLHEKFGDKIAAIVDGCSEPDKSMSWEERKEHTLHYLRTAPWEVRVVSCVDKLHNLRTIAAEHARVGERVWDRFKRGRKEQEWYYRGLVESLRDGYEGDDDIPFYGEFKEEVEKLFG
jgi:(p)ppGpp synthase/HD superfamily hydrolase